MNLTFTWKLLLNVAPDQLWRYISDTNRLNQAAGLPEWAFHYVPEADGGSRQIGEMRYMGWRMTWDEHPFEWVEDRQYEVVRVYHNGPIKRFHTSVLLHAQNGGTLLEQTVTAEPRWLIVAPAMYWEIGHKSRGRFERAYRDIEKFLLGQAETAYRPPPKRPIPSARLAVFRQKLSNAPGCEWLPRLVHGIETLPDYELDRMRPFAFADHWGADRNQALRLFLHAAQAGLLDLSWDVICPSCRGAKERHESLRDLRKEAHCVACNIRYTANFADCVEVTFRPNPSIRRLEVADYCSGGPMNAPHVVAQQRIPPGDSRKLELTLNPGHYRLRSLKVNGHTLVRIRPESPNSRANVTIRRESLEPSQVELAPEISIQIKNADTREITIMLERTAWTEQAATAAMVTAMNEFRTLFSAEVLAPDTTVAVGALALMFTDLKASTALYERIGEASAYALVRDHFDILRESIAKAEGAVVKTIGDSVMAAFRDPGCAVQAAFNMHRGINEDNRARGGNPVLVLKIGIHHGSCIAVNLNDVLDYFGTAVNLAARIQKESQGNDIVITDEVWSDPYVQRALSRNPHDHEVLEVTVRGISGLRKLHRLVPKS